MDRDSLFSPLHPSAGLFVVATRPQEARLSFPSFAYVRTVFFNQFEEVDDAYFGVDYCYVKKPTYLLFNALQPDGRASNLRG